MGLVGSYIEMLPDAARDRLIEAQDWCVAGVVGPGGARCLVGHAEDWRRGAPRADEGAPADAGVELGLFALRGAHPADLPVYRRRVARWGVESECRIGTRFDRLWVRLGPARAVRLIKGRAGRVPLDAPADATRSLRP